MRRLIMGATLAAALVGRARAEDCADTGVGELGAALVEHSCFHTTNGPFAEVTATPGAAAQPSTPDIDAVHTHYTVTIDPAQTNVVTYRPVRSGNWALFGDADIPHVLLDASGVPVEPKLAHPVAGCDALPIVRVYALTAQTRYTLRLGPGGDPRNTTRVVVEKVSDFEARHGLDLDEDGFGGTSDVVVTPCVPPSGYVPDLSDCDDSEPAIHPDAVEACDGIDNNCNGLGDEGACTTGGGGGCAVATTPDRDATRAWLALLILAAGGIARARQSRR